MDSKYINKEEKHCEDCLAYYTGNHTCPPWMKALVKRHKDMTNIKDLKTKISWEELLKKSTEGMQKEMAKFSRRKKVYPPFPLKVRD